PHRLLQPQRRAKVHYIHQQRNAQPLAFFDAFIGKSEIKMARRRLELVPRQRIAQVRNSKVFLGALQILAPEAIVLCPVELIDVQMRNERALQARSPDELRERQSARVERLLKPQKPSLF